MSTRIYLPLTSAGLAALVADARVAGPSTAHAVTAALQAEWPEGDQEEWEYAALAAAAEASWALRGDGDRPRRYVVAADVADDAVAVSEGPDEELTAVTVAHDVAWKNVAALHTDTDDRDAEGLDEHQLAWFATQEISELS